MAFDRSMPAPLILSPAPAAVPETQVEQSTQTLLERVAARETAEAPFIEAIERKVTFADILFATIVTTLSIGAALLGITAAVFLIGLGLAFYIVPMIAAIFVAVTVTTGVLLVFRKEIKAFVAKINSRSEASADIFQTA